VTVAADPPRPLAARVRVFDDPQQVAAARPAPVLALPAAASP
jgi:hypothetical protein